MLLLLGLSLWGCQPKNDNYIEDLDLVVTDYDKNANFSSKKTYAVSDSIVKLFTADYDSPTGDTMPEFVDPTLASQIIAKIDANMSARGYNKVAKNANPDLTILVSAMQTTNVYYYYDYYYWAWYYPYYWYYPYTVVPVSTSESGTLMMQMVSNADVNPDKRVPVIWLGILNGLLEGSSSSIASRVASSIDQAFVQSPYIKH